MLTKLNIYKDIRWNYLCHRVWQKVEDQAGGQTTEELLTHTCTDIQRIVHNYDSYQYIMCRELEDIENAYQTGYI